ncbi:MAG: GTPase [Bacilli bacterium]|nr:GTPase [Bacilli bacterium]MDY4619514.1 GTPase [Bacilli bacterium]
MNKCIGCGKALQYEDINKIGYAVKGSDICKRCFDLTHYNKNIELNNYIDNNKLLENINKKKIFTIFLCDILSLSNETIRIYENIQNDKVFVLTKVDILPKNIKYESIIRNIENSFKIKPLIFSYKNTKLKNNLFSLIEKHKKVLITGIVSSGKSTLINTLFDENITVSHYRNTTLDFIEINKDNLTIIDSPGFDTKVITERSKNVLKEKIINLKKGFELTIDNISLYSDDDINICIFMPNLMVKTYKNKDKYKMVKINNNTDLVFDNFFIYFKKGATIYLNNDSFNLRESIIGKKYE